MTPLRSTSLSLTFLSLALGLGACVADNADSGLIVLRAATPDSDCRFAPGGDTFMTRGHIQSNAGGYLIAPEVRNDLALIEGESVSAKTILVNGARVEIEIIGDLFSDAEKAALAEEGLTRFEAPFSGSVEPNGSTATLPFELVPIPLLRRIGARLPAATEEDPFPSVLLDAQLRIIGTRRGADVESNLFHFPVDVCEDCLVRDLGQCVDLPSGQEVSTGGACQPLQDGVLDCCHGIDPDDLEVNCPAEEPGPGQSCDDGVNEEPPFVCPAVRQSL